MVLVLVVDSLRGFARRNPKNFRRTTPIRGYGLQPFFAGRTVRGSIAFNVYRISVKVTRAPPQRFWYLAGHIAI